VTDSSNLIARLDEAGCLRAPDGQVALFWSSSGELLSGAGEPLGFVLRDDKLIWETPPLPSERVELTLTGDRFTRATGQLVATLHVDAPIDGQVRTLALMIILLPDLLRLENAAPPVLDWLSPPVSEDSREESARSVARRILELDFSGFRGLPSDLRVEDMLRQLPPIAERPGRGDLGSEFVPTRFWSLRVPSASRARAWFDESGHVTRIDLEAPEDFDWKKQRESWGPVDAVMDGPLGGVVLHDSNFVWARRGLTLMTNEEQSAVISVALYPPSSLDSYLERVHLVPGYEEHPAEE
jgi:hypothetical protein